MGLLRLLFGTTDRDADTEQRETELGTYEAGDASRLPTRGLIDLRRAQREQRRAVGGWWRDEYGGWHQVEED